MDRGKACSRRGDLWLGHQRSLVDTYRTEAPLCCVGSSVEKETHQSFSHMDVPKNRFAIFVKCFCMLLAKSGYN